MALPTFLSILKTSNSEVSKKTLFKSRSTYFVPDLFFISLYMTLFVFSGVVDILFISFLFFHNHKIAAGVIFLVTIIIPGILEFLLDFHNDYCVNNLKMHKMFKFLISIIGFSAFFNSSRVYAEIFATGGERLVKPMTCFTYPFFQTQNESFFPTKIHCLANSAFKSLPRLIILPFLVLHHDLNGTSALLGIILIMTNMVLFSLTIAITVPFRTTPRVFTSSICVLLNSFNKFMATMSACGVILALFATVFKSIQFYALVIPALRCITWIWPCWKGLQAVPLTKLSFFIFFILSTFYSSFIYIHPFQGIGKLHYYFFYFIDFVEEIILIYAVTDARQDFVTTFFCFRVVMIGFLSNFGLLNILHKYKDEETKRGCASSSNITDGMADAGAQEIQPEKSQTIEMKESTPVS